MQDVRSLVNQTKFDLDTSHMSGGYTEEYKKKLGSICCGKVSVWSETSPIQHSMELLDCFSGLKILVIFIHILYFGRSCSHLNPWPKCHSTVIYISFELTVHFCRKILFTNDSHSAKIQISEKITWHYFRVRHSCDHFGLIDVSCFLWFHNISWHIVTLHACSRQQHRGGAPPSGRRGRHQPWARNDPLRNAW